MPVMSRSQPVIAGNHLQSGGAAVPIMNFGKSCTSNRDPGHIQSEDGECHYVSSI